MGFLDELSVGNIVKKKAAEGCTAWLPGTKNSWGRVDRCKKKPVVAAVYDVGGTLDNVVCEKHAKDYEGHALWKVERL